MLAVLLGALVAAVVPASSAVAFLSSPQTWDVAVQQPVTLQARGAAVSVPVQVTCPTGAFASLEVTVTQRSGSSVVSGSRSREVSCTGSPQQLTVNVLATSGSRVFKRARRSSRRCSSAAAATPAGSWTPTAARWRSAAEAGRRPPDLQPGAAVAPGRLRHGHVHQLPDVTVEVLEAAAVHRPVLDRRPPWLAARGDRPRDERRRPARRLSAVRQVITSVAVAASLMSPLTKSANRSSRAASRRCSGRRPCRRTVVGERRVEREAELGEEGLGGAEVGDRQVDEDHAHREVLLAVIGSSSVTAGTDRSGRPNSSCRDR